MTAALRIIHSAQPSGAEVLDTVEAFISRFNVFPSGHCAPMLALWYAHTWVTEHFYVTPRLIVSSAEPGSGKTRVLEVGQYLVKAPEMTVSGSAPALFRMVGAGPVTILFDEVDTIFSAKAGGNEEVRAMLNAGYKRTATIPRCKGDSASGIVVERHPVYAPAALAGIAGGMPHTITTRAITIHLRRRRYDEHVDAFREKAMVRESAPIRETLVTWITGMAEKLGEAEPAMPNGVSDRAAEIWEPLLAIADAAGGHWPERAREACVHFVNATKDAEPSLRVRLLADIRTLFTQAETDRLHTADILRYLHSIEEAPWGDLWGKALNARTMAKELEFFQVKPLTVKCNGANAKGYVTYPTDKQVNQVGLADAWSRYLPKVTPLEDDTGGRDD